MLSSESPNADADELKRITKQNEDLISENNRLAMELDAKNKQIQELQAQIQGDQNGYGAIQTQSIAQIRSLGEENRRLKDELVSLRSENVLLKSKKEIASGAESVVSLKQEIDRLKRELELQKLQQPFQAQQAQQAQPSFQPLHPFSNTVPIESLSLQELRDRFQSEHTQCEALADYAHNVEETVDRFLRETLPPESLPASNTPTHTKIALLVESLRSASVYEAEIADLREKAEANYQCSQEWEQEANRLQDQLTNSTETSDYLRSCVDCAQHYLFRLVGSDFSQHFYDRAFLETQFQLVCRRSEKLLAEYQSVKQRLQQRAGDASAPDSATLARIGRLIQRVGERLNFLDGANAGRAASWAALERCLQDVFTFADVVVPKTRETIVKKDGEIRRLQRELKRLRPFEASGLL